MIKVVIPATSANLGAGFDCLGMALDLYNTIEVEEIDHGVEIHVPEEDRLLVENNESNLVYMTIKSVLDKVGYPIKGIRIKQVNGIPITRGLGSSAACIVGGILAANRLSGNQLSMNEMISIATLMDGHPDNVLPAFVGGITVACMEGREVHYVKIMPPENIKFAVMVPSFTLSTAKARKVLPQQVPLKDAVYNIGRASLFIASLMTGAVDNFWTSTQDRLHQPYRKKLIPHWDEIVKGAREMGAKGVFLSGAGPTMIAILNGNYQEFQHEMTYLTADFEEKWDIRIIDPCADGAYVL